MITTRIPKRKINAIRRKFIKGDISPYKDAASLALSPRTIKRYCDEFEKIKDLYPGKLKDMSFFLPRLKKEHRQTHLYNDLVAILPKLISEQKKRPILALPLWRKYNDIYPDGYKYNAFKLLYKQWAKDSSCSLKTLIDFIPEGDARLLNQWRRSNNHRNWQVATTLFAACNPSTTILMLMDKVDAQRKTITGWLANYREKGITGLELTPVPRSEKITDMIKLRKENLVKLLHEPPKVYGVNRASWSIKALAEVYSQVHDEQVSFVQIKRCLVQLGYKYRQSRNMMTSPDMKYREKIDKLQTILQNLKPNEKFFSIDEYGPVSIRIKGGRVLKHKSEHADIVPEFQKNKG
ncbi:MAG: hypothetical protein EOP48_27110, partial [Sphingobacteriales bacterium]